MSKRKSSRAFTLIELMIVVVVMALIAAVLVPAAISRLQRSELEGPSERIAQGPPALAAFALGERRVDPRIVSSKLDVTLAAQPVLDGFRVQNRYRASFNGRFVVENVDPGADTISVRFPFPPGTAEARNVSLALVDGEELREPRGVRYLAEGIEWSGAAPAGAPLTFVVTYEAVGRDAFTYDVAGQGRTDRIDVEIELVNAPEVEVPPDSLTPTRIERDRIVWSLERAVASRPIIVELPAGASSLGKLILLFQLAAIGVLLFGAGFWYASERVEPGRLDDFRWGHFLLLALDYSLFFAVFGVVVYGGSPLVALSVAGLVSLPLLGLHVSRVLDVRFAIRSVLPLAIYSLAAVVGAVYLVQHRSLVLLGATVVAVAYLTATYRGFALARREHAERKRSEQAKDQFRVAVEAARSSHRAGERALAEAPSGFGLERAELETALERSKRAIAAEDRELVLQASKEVEAAQSVLQSALLRARSELKESVARLDAEIETSSVMLDSIIEGESAAASLAREARRALEEVLAGARALLLEVSGGAPKELAARAVRTRSLIASRTSALSSALSALAREHVHAGHHCSACGSGSDGSSAFCPDCGTPRPHAIDCSGCGAIFRVPVQVAKKTWRAAPIHCERCGEALRVG